MRWCAGREVSAVNNGEITERMSQASRRMKDQKYSLSARFLEARLAVTTLTETLALHAVPCFACAADQAAD